MAKCKKDGCEKQAAPKQAYCSRTCAPLGMLGAVKDTSFDLTVESTSKVPGAASTLSNAFERRTRKDTQNVGTRSKRINGYLNSIERNRKPTMIETRTESPKRTEPDGIQSLSGGARRETPLEASEKNLSTQEARSVEPSQILGRDESALLNSIERSSDVLLGLMTSVEKSVRTTTKLEPALINSAANCAAQIQKLLRLKMDVVKGKAR